MPASVSPRELSALLERAAVRVIDVREPDEWTSGFIAGSRSIPLGRLRDDPGRAAGDGPVVFVCARGVRSATAAKLAEDAGIAEVSSLDGGIARWRELGLPLELPPAPTKRADVVPEPDAGDAAACGLPPPGLDAIVGANFRQLRNERNLTLDALARQTGLSRALLGQIENGLASPSVAVVWRIAQAFDVPFSALLTQVEHSATRVMRGAEARRLVSPDGRFSSRALYPLREQSEVEFYELFFAAHSREDAVAHRAGTKEWLVVAAGRLDIDVAGVRYELGRGDAITFVADVPHAYVNPGAEDCWAYLVMTYAPREPGG